MSLPVMQSLKTWLEDAQLLSGYQVLYNKWSDSNLKGSGGFILFRTSGPGVANRIQQRHDIDIYLVAEAHTLLDAQGRIEDIHKHLSSVAQPPDVVRYSVPTLPVGPFEMTNGRQVFRLSVFAYQSGGL